jgi:hypothetical protein
LFVSRHKQNNDDFVKLVQTFAKNYCKLEEASSSETVSRAPVTLGLVLTKAGTAG